MVGSSAGFKGGMRSHPGDCVLKIYLTVLNLNRFGGLLGEFGYGNL